MIKCISTATEIKLDARVFFPIIGSKPWTFLKEMSSNDFATGFKFGMVKKEIKREE